MEMKCFGILTLLFFVSFKSYAHSGSHGGQRVLLSRQTQQSVSLNSKTKIINFADKHANPSFESRLGNQLLEIKDSEDILILSFPAVIERSSFHPFGDGQSNSRMSLGLNWKHTEPPVIGILKADGTRKYNFHPSLFVTNYHEVSLGNGQYKVTPQGWQDSFYFSFDTGIQKLEAFLNGIPESLRTFSKGRVAPDPAHIGNGGGISRFVGRNLGEGYNADPWYSDSVHERYPDASGINTAIGGVYTWGLTEKIFGPFKQLYTCFEARNPQLENSLGVPSGAGWHQIGDAAETLLNNLESASLPVAIANSIHKTDVAFGLTEVITATWLHKEEVFVANQGQFHWYLNPYETEVCTEIWVHNCIPNMTNNWGFNCN